MKDIVVEQVSKRFGEKRVLEHFSAVFAGGETTCIMGDSGCGKTTLLNLLMGFEKADGGRITGVPEHMSTVFQEDRLCEAFGAVSNIRLVLGRKVPAEWIRDHLRELGLDGDAFDNPVSEFSGGMNRRVAIARAVSYGGDVLFMDEPFMGLDESTKKMAAAYVRRHAAGRTVIMVTHDESEVELMGGHLIRMVRGAEEDHA